MKYFYLKNFIYFSLKNKLCFYFYEKLSTLRSQNHASNSGYALVFLCLLLPLILTVIFYIYAKIIQVEMKSHLHQICRRELLAAQAQASKAIQQIMKLNHSRMATKMHSMPRNQNHLLPSIAEETKASNSIHNLLQLSRNHLKKGKEELQSLFERYQHKLDAFIDISDINIYEKMSPNPSIELKTSPLFNKPYFQFKENFEQIQSLTLFWTYQLKTKSHFSNWDPWPQKFKGQCSATLKKEAPWLPILYEDRLY